jgi:hypothetical protein
MPDARQCRHCCRTFQPKRSTERLCGGECRTARVVAERLKARERDAALMPRPCRHCGTDFIPARANERMCSAACRKARVIEQQRKYGLLRRHGGLAGFRTDIDDKVPRN